MSTPLLNFALKRFASDASEPAQDLFAPQYVEVGQFKLRYLHSHKQDAPTLLLLNGYPQSIRMWEHAWAQLAEHFNLLAFDIPGFGLSGAQEQDMSPRKLSEVVIQMMDKFGIDKAHLVGPDVGVPITLATAIQYPERLLSINVFDGPGGYPAKLSWILKSLIDFSSVRSISKGIGRKSVMLANFLTAVKLGYRRFKPNRLAIREYHQIAFNDQGNRCVVSFFGSYQQDLSWIQSRLHEIKLPALITWGKRDPFVYADNAHFLAGKLAANKVVMFEDASHFSAEDASEEYTQLLIRWCQEEHKALLASA